MLVGGGERPRVASRIEGKGWNLGITLRQAMFQALLGASMASMTDRILPLGDLLGPPRRGGGVDARHRRYARARRADRDRRGGTFRYVDEWLSERSAVL